MQICHNNMLGKPGKPKKANIDQAMLCNRSSVTYKINVCN